MNLNIIPADLLKEFPIETAGALPSSRTADMTLSALESDDIDEVKMQLIHTWAHYQSLELALNDVAQNPDHYLGAIADTLARADVNPSHLLSRVFASAVLIAAYDNAHGVMRLMRAGVGNVVDALQIAYGDLDYSDPARELTDTDIEAFLKSQASE